MALLRTWCYFTPTIMVMIYSYKGMVEQKPYAMIVAYIFAALRVPHQRACSTRFAWYDFTRFAGYQSFLVDGESYL